MVLQQICCTENFSIINYCKTLDESNFYYTWRIPLCYTLWLAANAILCCWATFMNELRGTRC